MTNEQIARLKELGAKATPGKWEVDSEHCHDVGFHSFFIGAGVGLGGKWATLLDTVNSDHTLIRDERNGDGGNVWDVIGEANATLIVELRNALPEIIAALESVNAMRKALAQYRDDLRHPPTRDSIERRLAMIANLLYEVEPPSTNTCEMPEVAAMRYLEQLRSEYGASVTILGDDEEAWTKDRQTAIEVVAQWTNWEPARFYGESIVQCLAKAVGR